MKLHPIVAGRASTAFAVSVLALSIAACGGGGSSESSSQMTQQTTTGFTDTALVSNNVGVVATATTIDANLSNPWGLATAPGLPFWIADNNSNLATLYSGTGYESNEGGHRIEHNGNRYTGVCSWRAGQSQWSSLQRHWWLPHSYEQRRRVGIVHLLRRGWNDCSLGPR
jgi:hypothetical protein